MWKRLRHYLLGHPWVHVGTSTMGAPISKCAQCGQYMVLYGYGSSEHLITYQEAVEIGLEDSDETKRNRRRA